MIQVKKVNLRLEKLEITNITSLKGDHQIDFPRDLAGEDLFAITGPTGSGKSSLLAAMTLALYGRGAKTELSGPDFISQGSREALVRLSFSTHGKSYQAVWSCVVLNKKGAPLTQPRSKRELYQADNEGQWVPVEKTPEEVIGLNFDQFSKTVVLNQGEFAKFLTSSFAERRAILEKLYQGEALSGLKSLLNQRCKDQQEKIDQLLNKKESLLPFGVHEYEEDKKKIKTAAHEFEAQNQLYQKLKQLDIDLQRLRELSQSLKRNREKRKTHQDQHQAVNAKKVEKKQEQIKKEQAYQQSIANLKERRPLFQGAIDCKKNEKQIKLTLEKLSQQQLKTQQLIEQKKQERQKMSEQIGIDQKKLEEIKNQLPKPWQSLELDARQKLSQDLNKSLERIYPLETGEHQLRARLDQAQQELESSLERGQHRKKLYQQGLEEIEALKQKIKEQFGEQDWSKEVEKCLMTRQKIENFLELSDQAQKSKQTLDKELDELEVAVKTLGEKMKLAKLEEDCEQKNAQIFALQHSINLLRQANSEKDECLVCGSELKQASEFELKKEDFDPQKLEAAKKRCDEIFKEQQKAQSQLELKNKLKQENTEKEQGLFKQLEEFCDFYQLPLDNNSQALLKEASEKKLLEAQQKAQEFERQKQQLIKLENNSQWLDKELVQLRGEFQQKQEKIKEDKSALAQIEKDLEEIKKLLPQTDIDTQGLQKLKNLLDQSVEAQMRINKDQQYSLKMQQEITQLGLEEQQIKPEIAKQNEIQLQNQTKLMEFLTLLGLSKAQEDKIEEQLENLEKQQELLYKEKEAIEYELQQIVQDESYHRTLISSLDEQQQDINQTAQIHKARLLETIKSEEAIASEERRLRWFSKIEGLSFEVLNEESILAFENLIMDQFTPFYDNVADQIKERQALLSELNARIALYEKQKKLGDQISAELELWQTKHTQYKNLQLLIGKDEFRNFALSIIENELVAHTNKELERICDGRYQIDLKKTVRGQEYLITDFWQGGAERKVSTLSGGETFLVSLAMALSLAEMCRGETQIDSFFIDEGFGTLDQDSLDEVIETLFTVRSRGKQIGIISHVKELTGRIPVNIDIQKDSHGQGQIQILYN